MGARGTPHAFANRNQEPARFVIMWIPGGAEGVFAEMEVYRQSAKGAPDAQALAAIMASYGATTVGPAIPIPEPSPPSVVARLHKHGPAPAANNLTADTPGRAVSSIR